MADGKEPLADGRNRSRQEMICEIHENVKFKDGIWYKLAQDLETSLNFR